MSNGPVVVHGQVRPCALRASWMVGGFCAHHSAALRGRTALASAAAKNIVLKCDQRALISPTLGLPGQSSLVEALGGCSRITKGGWSRTSFHPPPPCPPSHVFSRDVEIC